MIDRVHDHDLADRHAGTIGGRLQALEAIVPAHVVVVVSAAAAHSRAGQLLATHTANLLGRMEGVVGTIACVVEGLMPLLYPDIDPRDRNGGIPLFDAIKKNASLAAVSRYHDLALPGAPTVTVGIGATERACDLYAAASAWGAYVGRKPAPHCSRSARGGIGPYVAASFVAAEVFRSLRMTGHRAVHPVALTFDAWRWEYAASLDAVDGGAPDPWGIVLPNLTFAGVGAVGCAAALTLWASGCVLDALLVDGDKVSRTNLNRYVLFALDDVNASKVMRASELLSRSPSGPHATRAVTADVRAFDGWWVDYMQMRDGGSDAIVVSGVDTNTARHQIQDSLPGLILGASTHNLRAEVGRYDLGDDASRCLKCFNAPEALESDQLMQRRLLGMDDETLIREAADRGVPIAQLRAYVKELRAGGHGCAILAGPSLDKLRRANDEEAFAVSFVSSLAGSLLAAQVIREAVGAPLLVASVTRAQFQFERPESADANACFAAPRDPDCACNVGVIRLAHEELWKSAPALTAGES